MHWISPRTYRRITFLAVVALGVIVVTGAAVRLTGSGLGCPDWPNCEPGRLTPHGTTGYHGDVEFVNRTFTGLVSVLVIATVLGSLGRTGPRRRDLVWLSVGLVAGVVAQIVLGGLTVIYGLSPPWVMAHFLVSMVLVADAVVLHHRAGIPDGARALPAVGAAGAISFALVTLCAAALFAGTVVTGTGPHGGDEHVRRLGFSITTVARVHGITVMAFLAAVLYVLWRLNRERAPVAIRHNANVLLAVLCAQATVGYIQYFAGVPVVLVGVHIVGAVSVWIATLHFVLHLRTPVTLTAEAADLVELSR